MIAYFNGFRVSCALQKQVLPVFIQFYFCFCTKWCLLYIVIYPEEIKNKFHIENSGFLPLIYCRKRFLFNCIDDITQAVASITRCVIVLIRME